MDIPTDDKYNLSEATDILSSSEPDAGPLYDADEVYREVCDKEFLDSFGDEGNNNIKEKVQKILCRLEQMR